MKRIITPIVTLLLTFTLSGCFDDDDDDVMVTPEPEVTVTTIVDAAVSNGNFTTLVAALQATGLDETLANENATFTVFAPTDDAFALLGQDTIDALLDDTDTLSAILTYHVLDSEVNATAAIAAAGTAVDTVNGAKIGLSLDGDSLLVNTSTVTITDLMTDNGIIHVIDAVLMPPELATEPTMNIVETAVADGRFTTLVTALQTAGLDGALADANETYTVFAPTDDAFAMIDENLLEAILADQEVLSDILLQHVVKDLAVDSVTAYTLNGASPETMSGAMIPVAINSDSDMLTFGGANIIIKDIATTNGIIHVIDMVVVADVTLPEPILSIKDVAEQNGNFTTLVAALEATELDLLLDDNTKQFTVFAPTDAAFALLGEDTINDLLANPTELANILQYHVLLDAEVLADAAVTTAQSDMNMIDMANGDKLSLSYVDSMLYANKSLVSGPNVMAENGVIHVIDQVILPPAEKGTPTSNIVEVAVADDRFETLVAALTAADLVDTLSNEDASFTVFAPTDAAFDKIDDTVLAGLLADVPALTNVLLQHVVGAEISSIGAYAANGTSVNTEANDDVTVSIVNYTSFTNGADDEVAYDAASEMLVSGAGGMQPGFTLYVFDDDLGMTGSACNDTCATNWPPVLVTDGNAGMLPNLGMVERDDGSMQATFKGRPLYYFASDMAVGDMTGQGVGGKWWVVEQPQTSLEIQGAGVIINDIYTTNGVIHVIDTVITETLEP